ncbi:MAG TPA: histidine phosphotransferase family protein [Azospirillaceae bacterium]|nr:histidine phosphotransferase family protein [Azospirillaceae bacterium]
MDQGMDTRAVELLCSRLCHDLVSPVGAVNNGVELIEEMREDGEEAELPTMLGDAIGLIAHSAGQAALRLKLFRFAYGTAGASPAGGFVEARAAAEGWLAGGKVSLDWPGERPAAGLAGHVGTIKVLLNLIVLADEILTHGGAISVDGAGSEVSGSLIVTVAGPTIRFTPEAEAALNGAADPCDLTPRTIHAYATGRFAAQHGIRLGVETSVPDRLSLRADW